MDRSLAARATRPFGAGAAAPLRPSAWRLPRLGSLLPGRARLVLVCVLVALPLLGGGWLLLRSSPLVSVSHVRITGVEGPHAEAIEAALDSAARRMSTLNVDVGALRAAVAPFPLVRNLRVRTSFPHTLRIAVEEELPVAALEVGGARTAVAADGAVLGPALLRGNLPLVQAGATPLGGGHVTNYYARAALDVISAAPGPLAKLITRAYLAPQGIALALRSGPLAYFGDGERPHAKWLALARVLADPSSGGASYVDVRLPERPAAGFAASTTEQTSATTGAAVGGKEKQAPREASVQALAEALGAPTGSAAANAAAAAAGAGTSTTGGSETSEHEATSAAREGGGEGRETEPGKGESERSTSSGG